MCNGIKMEASDISEKFIDAFILFSHCYEIYDSNHLLSDAKITELGKYKSYILMSSYMILSKLVRDCHRPFHQILQDKISIDHLSPQATHARGPHSSLDEEVEDRLWMHGRAGSRVTPCLI